jgi:hypothetical protein
LGVHTGNFSAGLNWDYNHQDEWLIARNIYVNGDLTFWSYAVQGSLHQDHYYVKLSTDQGATWNVLMDLSSLPPYPSSNGVNAWNTPYHADLSMYDGQTVDIAWHAVDGDGNGLWFPWAIDDCSIGADDHLQGTPAIERHRERTNRSLREVIGYDVYRKSTGATNFVKINPVPVTDTTLLDEGLPVGQYYYFVQALFSECERASNSDTIMVDHVTGVDAFADGSVSVFPNPAFRHVTVTSASAMQEVCLYGPAGNTLFCRVPSEKKKFIIDTGDLSPGLYTLRVLIDRGVTVKKICVQRD